MFRPGFGVRAKFHEVGVGRGEIAKPQATDGEKTSAEAQARGAGEAGAARLLGADDDGRSFGADAVKPEIGVSPLARAEQDLVSRLRIANGAAQAFRIRHQSGSVTGECDAAEDQSDEGAHGGGD